jgi:hypothetical protein
MSKVKDDICKEASEVEIILPKKDEIPENAVLIDLKIKPENPEKNFEDVIAVGKSTELEIYIENPTDEKWEGFTTSLYIFYPDYRPEQGGGNRPWEDRVMIPGLESREKVKCTKQKFFTPMVSGVHKISIIGKVPYRLIAPIGLFGSKYRVTNPGFNLPFNFNVVSEQEYQAIRKTNKQLKTAKIMLLISAFVLFITILQALPLIPKFIKWVAELFT